MKIIFALVPILFFTSNTLCQSVPKITSDSNFSIGRKLEFHSDVLSENRQLNIYLPLSYQSDSSKIYPVIYLLDGSMDEDFIHISGLVQFGSFSWINLLPESIVVGIANVDRKRDFTSPSQNELDLKELPTSGKSANFIQFLEKEVQTLIDKTFRTTQEKTIIGQSLGGLLATEILFTKPDLFDNYIIVSPSLWWNDKKLLKEKPIPYESKKSIYIAVGKEGEMMEKPAKQLFDLLNENKKEHTNVFFEFLEDKNHGDALHIAVYNAFEMIFGKKE